MSTVLARVYDDAVTITPSDTVVQAANSPFAGLLVTVAGTGLVFVTPTGNVITMTGAIPVGTEIHVRVKQVKFTGTGCSVAGYQSLPYRGF